MYVLAKDVGKCSYITPGKHYKLKERRRMGTNSIFGGNITDDSGDRIFIRLKSSAHIGYNDWELVND